MNIRVPRWLHYGISLLLAVGLGYAVVGQFHDTQALGQLDRYLNDFQSDFSIWPLLLAIIMMPVNWGMEVYKWKILVPRSGFEEAAEVVLGGLSWSIWTPLGVGDYVGRAYVQKNQRAIRTAMNTFMASFTQNMGNALWAILLVGFIDTSWKMLWGINWWVYALGFFLLLLILFFIVPKDLLPGIPARTDRLNLLNWSVVRALIYILQYALVLQAFGSDVPFSVTMMLIAIVYLWQSGMPVPEVVGIILKVELAILIFSYEGINELLAVLSALSIWMINRLTPAIVGYIGILKMSKDESTIHI